MQISYLTNMEGSQNFPVWGALPLPPIHQVWSLSNCNFPCYSDLKKVNGNFNAHTHTHIHPWRTGKCPVTGNKKMKTMKSETLFFSNLELTPFSWKFAKKEWWNHATLCDVEVDATIPFTMETQMHTVFCVLLLIVRDVACIASAIMRWWCMNLALYSAFPFPSLKDGEIVFILTNSALRCCSKRLAQAICSLVYNWAWCCS